MTDDTLDPILDAFTSRLAAVELLVPAKPPVLDGAADAGRINVIGGIAMRPTGRARSGSTRRTILAPIGLAAAVVIGLVGVSLVATGGAGPGAAPTATPTSSPAGPVYRPMAFQLPVGLTFGTGWTTVVDAPRELTFRAPITGAASSELGTVTIAILDNVSVDTCRPSGSAGPTMPWSPATPAAGPQALIDWIESSSGVPHDPPRAVTIAGIAGLETTLSPGVGSLTGCGGTAILSDLGAERTLRIGENEAMRIAAIPVGDRTLLVVTHVPHAVLLTGFASKADQLIDTLDLGSAK